MSLQWTLIASFLYLEIVIVLLLVLPVASPRRWQRIFKSRMLQFLSAQASFYFIILLAILVIFLLDAIREIRKYSEDGGVAGHDHLDKAMQNSMRLFRAQRNLYISGFALFLSLVIRRLVILLSEQATLLAQAEANMKQAQSATNAAKALMAQKGVSETAQNSANEENDRVTEKLRAKLSLVEEQLEKEKKDKEALKSQSESLSREYDRLTDEYAKLQNKCVVTGDRKAE